MRLVLTAESLDNSKESTVLNEILKQLKERKSVRVFESKEINPIIKDEIVQAAIVD